MPTPITIRRRSTDSTAPTTSDIAQHELAYNKATRLLYTRDNSDNIITIGSAPKGTVDGSILIWNSTTELWEEGSLTGSTNRPTVTTDATTARTLTLADENSLILFTSSSAVTVTLPTDAEDDLPIGFICHLHQEGTGQVTASSGGTVRSSVGPNTYTQYSSISVMKIASDTWKIVGDQAA